MRYAISTAIARKKCDMEININEYANMGKWKQIYHTVGEGLITVQLQKRGH